MATLAVKNATKKSNKLSNTFHSSVQIIDVKGQIVPPDNRRPPPKKRNQKEWDELITAIKSFCREEGLPVTISNNPLLFLMEEMGEMTTAFPPPALTISNNTMNATCMKVLINIIRCQAFATYQQTFAEPSKGIRSVSVWNSPVTDEGIKSVVALLLHFPLITKLELMDCAITQLACAHLAPAIAQRAYTNLKILRINHNPIGNEGLANLVEAMYYNSHLQELTLDYCGISGEIGAKWIEKLLLIPDSAVTTLHIRGNELGEFGLHAIARALVSTTKSVKGKPTTSAGATRPTTTSTTTRTSTAAVPTRLTTAAIVKPATSSTPSVAIPTDTTAAIAPLSVEPDLITIHSPLRVLSYNQNRYSSLENQTVLMDFLLAITKYSQLTAIDLSGNTIHNEGMQRIIFAMQECKHIQHLNVNTFVNLEENEILKNILSKNIPPRIIKKKKKKKMKKS